MRKPAILAAILASLLSTSAMAWNKEDCKREPTHPDCKQYQPPVVTPAPPASWSNNFTSAPVVTNNFTSNPVTTVAPVTKQSQSQSQWQTQDASLDATLNQSGSQVGTGGSVKGSGNSNVDVTGVGSNNGSTVNLTTADNSSSKTTFLPALVAQTPPSTSQIGNIVKTTTACGPMMKVITTRTEGKFFGIMSDSSVDLGRNDQIVDADVPYIQKKGVDGRMQVFGHQADMVTAILNVSGGRSIGFGGFSSSGGGAQGTGGTSGSMTEMVTNVIALRSCEAYGYKTETVAQPDVSALAAALAAQMAMKTELSAPTYEKQYVPCPKEGCKAPKVGYYKMVPKGTVSATSEVGVKASNAVKKP